MKVRVNPLSADELEAKRERYERMAKGRAQGLSLKEIGRLEGQYLDEKGRRRPLGHERVRQLLAEGEELFGSIR